MSVSWKNEAKHHLSQILTQLLADYSQSIKNNELSEEQVFEIAKEFEIEEINELLDEGTAEEIWGANLITEIKKLTLKDMK